MDDERPVAMIAPLGDAARPVAVRLLGTAALLQPHDPFEEELEQTEGNINQHDQEHDVLQGQNQEQHGAHMDANDGGI